MAYKNAQFQEDLLRRTKEFSIKLIKILSSLRKIPANEVLVKQGIRSGTSIGANYREACEAESGKYFVHKIRICKKESKETIYWVELLMEVNQDSKQKLHDLNLESTEFLKIFASISSKFKS